MTTELCAEELLERVREWGVLSFAVRVDSDGLWALWWTVCIDLGEYEIHRVRGKSPFELWLGFIQQASL